MSKVKLMGGQIPISEMKEGQIAEIISGENAGAIIQRVSRHMVSWSVSCGGANWYQDFFVDCKSLAAVRILPKGTLIEL